MKDQFNFTLKDSQATVVTPISPNNFDIAKYQDYEAQLTERCKKFWESDSGVLVYRRMRVREVFAEDSCDMKKSLEWQLGALEQSMKFKADVPNFLEPWYGLGTAASAFGFDYLWEPGQAPAVNGKFETTSEALQANIKEIENTPVGIHTLKMVEYFLEATQGKLPMSYCDVQSPLNVAGNIIDSNNFLMDFYLNPDDVMQLLDKIASLVSNFTLRQQKMIGSALASPGHGFSSSRAFEGFGMSDDNAIMISNEFYHDYVLPSFVKTAQLFGGAAFHSCGNWSGKTELVSKIENLKMADAAFSKMTDPDPNPTENFPLHFAGTGIVINARIVGGLDIVEQKVRELWKPGMKLIVVTYCETPDEQEKTYDAIHKICS